MAAALRTGVAALCALLIAAPARPALAEDKPELGFSADEVEGDGRMRELVLRGNVVVTYERFRLTSPELGLQRTPRGIEVRGSGEVVFCPCANPPVSVGFEGGIVAPPADLFLRSPTLRVAGTTIFGLPWFWLRSPTRPGILPPNIAWRGADGLVIGDGIHVPWKDGDTYDELDLTASGYVKGGVEIVAKLRTPHSTERLRWDHLNGDLLAIDAHGSHAQDGSSAVAWDADAIRGSRARSATLSLDEASRGYDRAAGELIVRPSDETIVGAGVRSVASRGGGGPSERPAWGPRITLGGGGALGGVGAWDELATFASLADAVLGPTHLARAEGGVMFAARPSIFVTRLSLREAVTAADSRDGAAVDATGSATLEAAAPMARAFADEGVPIVHVIEPRLRGSILAAQTSGSYWSLTGRPVALASGRTAVASAGFRTAWGRLLGHSGGSLEADAGAFSDLSPWFGRVRSGWSSRFLGWGAEAAARLRNTRSRVLIGKARLGEGDGWHVTVKAAGRMGFEPIEARAIGAGNADAPSGGWLSAEGWSGGAEIAARFSRSLGARVSVDGDITARTLLATSALLSYAHPCRCISVDAYAAKRLGRDGVDVWIAIDLAPR